MKLSSQKQFSLLAMTGLLSLAACSGGGGSSGGLGSGPSNPPNPPTVTISGNFRVTDEVIQASGVCAGEIGSVDTYDVNIVQNGSDLTVTTPDGVFSGTLSGDQIQWSGSYPDDGGTTSIASMSLTATDNDFGGSVNWTWTDGSEMCQGQSKISGVRIVETRAQALSLTYLLNENGEIEQGEIRIGGEVDSLLGAGK